MKRLLIFCVVYFALLSAHGQVNDRLLGMEKWQFRKVGTSIWYPATVPGCVHTDLFKNKLIPDPYYGNNDSSLSWIEDQDWEYQTAFTLTAGQLRPGINWVLQFDGLDTYAEIFLNDVKILSADNMFRTWSLSVNDLKASSNILRIIFRSAVKNGREAASKLPYTLPGDEKVFARKSPYQYGWDFGPRFVTCGVWKQAHLISWSSARILSIVPITDSISPALAKLHLMVDIESNADQDVVVNPKVNQPMGNNGDMLWSFSPQYIHLKKGMNRLQLSLVIEDPKLWWCNGMGSAFLYDAELVLSKGKLVYDAKKFNIGIRKVELVQEPDKEGRSFYFKLNGKILFAKGANWIPPSIFPMDTAGCNVSKLIHDAVDANMNMFRVWGGGIYAGEDFYKECDRQGILVWQDLMFACSMVPGDPEFRENVSREVKEQSLRLMAHPSLALLCGNNEADEGWHNWGWQKQYNYTQAQEKKIWEDYLQLFRIDIPNLLKDQFGEQSMPDYISTSPEIGWGHDESLHRGDSHYWGVWWGMEPFYVYEKKIGRFVSEFGFQSLPSIETLQRSGCVKKETGSGNYLVDSLALKAHEKHPTGLETIRTYMEREYPVPSKVEDFIYVSQLLQAHGIANAIQAQRAASPRCRGSLFWQWNDCWPGITWSAIDYFGNKKALYYFSKRAFEPILLSFQQAETSCYLTVVSDKQEALSGKLLIQCKNFSGKIFSSDTMSINISPDIPLKVTAFDPARLGSHGADFYLEAVFTYSDLGSEHQVNADHFFALPKDLKLEKTTIQLSWIDEETIQLSTNYLAKDVRLSSPDCTFKENYLDLWPGTPIQVKVVPNEPSLRRQPVITIYSFADIQQ